MTSSRALTRSFRCAHNDVARGGSRNDAHLIYSSVYPSTPLHTHTKNKLFLFFVPVFLTMSFPITKLPCVPQVEVLKQLELQELFLMSLCSEKSKKLVQTANLKVEILKFSLNGEGIQVLVESDDDVHCVASMKLVQLASSDDTSIKLGGRKLQCRSGIA